MQLTTLEDQIRAPEKAPEAFVRTFKFVMPEGLADTPMASVIVNHGRWIARCPLCRGAEHASEHDHRFLCGSCFNRAVSGKWIRTVWPDNADEIEQVLMRRPDPDTRNWELAETVDDLKVENALHGVL